MVKIDFSKAFDTVNWLFLEDVLIQRGFPVRWVKWVKELLYSASSRVVINGEASDYFEHKQGLRQGDPLSPMLFLLVVNVLQQMIGVANSTLSTSISSKIRDSILALQYADDTALISNADTETLVTLKLILRLFSKISGLKINYSKSSFVGINLSLPQTVLARLILDCQETTLPITYLGMTLTIKKPTRQCFMPLIEKLEKRLQGWKGKLISRGVRAQLVNSVLTSIPIYFMNCFKLPKWVIQKIDKVRRLFLWGRNDKDARGISLINWDTACLPKKWGGVGIPNLELQNNALLLRWWWRLYHDPGALWCVWAKKIRSQGDGPLFLMRSGSFFWTQILKLETLFQWCTTWNIRDGKLILFWYDKWHENRLRSYSDGQPRPNNRRLSLADALPNISDLLPTLDWVPILSNGHDHLTWRWGSSGVYSAKSAYEMMVIGGLEKWGFAKIWSAKCPSTTNFFAFLLIRGKILTQDVLRKRRIHCDMGCVMCRNCPIESALHLFFLCPIAVQIWCSISTNIGFQIFKPGLTVEQIWHNSLEAYKNTCNGAEITWIMWFICVTWFIWKERNERVFRSTARPTNILVQKILLEGSLWSKYC